jgi:hypothetical protein
LSRDINATGVAFTHTLCGILKKAHAQTAHLVFAGTKANTEKPKELFFSQCSGRKDGRKSNFENE